MARRISEAPKWDKQRRQSAAVAQAFGLPRSLRSANCLRAIPGRVIPRIVVNMLESVIPMKTRQQRLRRYFTRSAIINGLTSAALGICLLLGPGVQVSNLIGDFTSSKSGTCFELSYQPDSAVSRLERQIPAFGKAPRRHASFGALPNAVELAVCNVTDERMLADGRCDSLTAVSHQNDRAPPV